MLVAYLQKQKYGSHGMFLYGKCLNFINVSKILFHLPKSCNIKIQNFYYRYQGLIFKLHNIYVYLINYVFVLVEITPFKNFIINMKGS